MKLETNRTCQLGTVLGCWKLQRCPMNAEFSCSGDSTDKYYKLNYCKGTIKKIEQYFQDGIDGVFPIVSRFQTDLFFFEVALYYILQADLQEWSKLILAQRCRGLSFIHWWVPIAWGIHFQRLSEVGRIGYIVNHKSIFHARSIILTWGLVA